MGDGQISDIEDIIIVRSESFDISKTTEIAAEMGSINKMFGKKKAVAPRPLNDSGRSLISETFSLEGTLRTSGAIDIAGLIKGPVYTNDLIIKETGSIVGPVETDKIEIYGHLEGKIVAKTIVIGSTAVVKGDILFSESLKTEEGADITGYIKKTESTSLEAAQNEFRLDSIEAKETKEKDKSKKSRPKIVASN